MKLGEIEVQPDLLKFLEGLGWEWKEDQWSHNGFFTDSRIIAHDLEVELRDRLRKKLEWPTLYPKFDQETEIWYMGYSNNGFIKANTEIECWIKAAYSFEII